MVALVSARTELRRAGVNSYFGICPFHDERTGSFHVRPDEKLYHCFGCQASGDPFKFVMETEGLDFSGALESLAERFGVELETEAEDPEAAARRAAPRAAVVAARARRGLLRPLPVGGRARPPPAREYLLGRGLRRGDAARVPGRLRARAPGTGCCWRRAGPGSATRSCSRSASPSARSRARARSTTASASGSCSRRPTPAGACVGFGARAMRDNQRPKYLNTADERALPQARAAVRDRPGPRGGRARGPDDPGRGLHRRARAPPGRAAQRGRDHGHLADRGAGRRARAGGERAGAVPRRRPGRPGGDAARGAAGRRAQARAARGAAARGHRPRRPDRARGRRRAARAASSARRRSSSSRSSGSWIGPTPAQRRGTRPRAGGAAPVLAELPASVLREDLLRRVAGQAGAVLEALLRRWSPTRTTPAAAACRPGNGASGQRRRPAGRPGGSRAERDVPGPVRRAAGRGGAAAVLDRPRATAHQRAAPPRRPAPRPADCASPLADLPPDDEELAAWWPTWSRARVAPAR